MVAQFLLNFEVPFNELFIDFCCTYCFGATDLFTTILELLVTVLVEDIELAEVTTMLFNILSLLLETMPAAAQVDFCPLATLVPLLATF